MDARVFACAAALACGLLSVGTASAAPAVTTAAVNIRSGPSTAYAAVRAIPANRSVTVFGCLAGYLWCDVRYGPYRGWVHGAYLMHVRPGHAVPIARAAVRIGVPIVAYDFATYHGLHYRGRPYYMVAPGVAIRRAARIEYRVQRRMERRWNRWAP